jgi:hypothetical protein
MSLRNLFHAFLHVPCLFQIRVPCLTSIESSMFHVFRVFLYARICKSTVTFRGIYRNHVEHAEHVEQTRNDRAKMVRSVRLIGAAEFRKARPAARMRHAAGCNSADS